MKLLKTFSTAQENLFSYFGYTEDWVAIPVDDGTEHFWNLTGEAYGDTVRYGKEEDVKTLSGEHYESSVYTQRFLPKWVYRADDYTMICVDTHVDGNKFLQIFDNNKEIKAEDMSK